ncbi:hypothetical protein FC093_20855 [Ilyomonas limi]|uniref:Uncharacterized protein n=1 Tax=Ilyomonas limi TaxID=2575867 RepID=A0A4U3KTQ3_9BACT|nr:hypothetical protein [Ilyomonas limi]TKK65119.1 hypothetical protein FC093_20855 [Ilyomonas limi]
MIFHLIKTLLITVFACITLFARAQVSFTSGELEISLNGKGYLTELSNKTTGKNYLYTDTLAPLITVVRKSKKFHPTSLTYNKSQKKITLGYTDAGVNIDIKVLNKPTHLILEIIKAGPADKIDAVVWGPYPTTINKTVGEVIGVVRDGTTSIGLQVLNVKTLGGDYPNNEGSTWQRGIAAISRPWGSLLQAYSINREHERYVDAWGGVYKNMPIAPIKGETVVGSKIALFSCDEPKTLDRLEQIELAENLPHPTIKGVWFKKSPLFGKSYLISSFSEKDVDEIIGYTKRAGLFSLYHEGPFKSWGHFVLNPTQFPNGKEGLKKCVEKAHAAGLMMGMHTLSNFINTNDPYITPVPDDRLSMTGSSTLMQNMDALQKEVEVASPEYFNQQESNYLHTVKIGSELIRYKSVTSTPPYQLLDCQRGAFGTTASAHNKGDVVGKLFDHGYGVFFPNINMQRDVAKNIAILMNETGIDHLDFDGFEGGLASGQGDYAVNLFAKDVYDNVKHEFICGTSISKSFFWHIGSYYNWGEPWYGGFKESMQEYRIANQALFDRNFMPHMLGWYLLAEHTTLPEMEWMLARAAGYNAGFALVARPDALRKNPLTPVLLDAIREWENARNGSAFSKEQQERLKNPANAFHLEKVSEGKWNFYQYSTSPVFVREKFERQPGEPTHTIWNFKQQWSEQPLQFNLNVTGNEGAVGDITMQIDNYAEINLPQELQAGESVVCDGTEILRLYDKDGKPKGQYKMSSPPPVVSPGTHSITIDCSFTGEKPPKIEVQFKGLDKMETVNVNKKG